LRVSRLYAEYQIPAYNASLQIVGLRNRIAHEYFDISLSIVWHLVMKELPTLEDQMKEISEQSST